MTEKEKEELRARTQKAIEDTKREMESDPPDTQYFYNDDLEKLIEASDKGDLEATKKLLQLFNSSEELKEYIKTFKEFLELQPLAKELIEAWKKAKKDGETQKAEIIKNELVAYKTIIFPETSVINNSKVANGLVDINKNSLEGKKTALNVAKAKDEETVNVIAYFTDKNVTIKGDPLTAYDIAVFNAVCTLYKAGNKLITLQAVYKAMNGIHDSNKKLTPQQLEPIKKSLNTMMFLGLSIDWTEQLKKQHYPELKKLDGLSRNEPLLTLSETTLKMTNGEIINAYQFYKCPNLYSYTECITQVINFPSKLLDTSKILSNTPEVILFRQYLIQRISQMKNIKNLTTNSILYETIFNNAGINTEELNKRDANRKRDNIKKILGHLKNEKFIKSYEEYKKGRAIAGIKIFF